MHYRVQLQRKFTVNFLYIQVNLATKETVHQIGLEYDRVFVGMEWIAAMDMKRLGLLKLPTKKLLLKNHTNGVLRTCNMIITFFLFCKISYSLFI